LYCRGDPAYILDHDPSLVRRHHVSDLAGSGVAKPGEPLARHVLTREAPFASRSTHPLIEEGGLVTDFDLIVIGSGPGGYVAAIRAGILGLKTAIVEKDPLLGGTCLHRGCIPTKALLHTAHLYDEIKRASDHGLVTGSIAVDFPKVHERKRGIESLMKKRKVEVVTGRGVLVDAETVRVTGAGVDRRIKAAHIILATGSTPADLPHIRVDHTTILDSDDVLSLETIPKSIAIVGAGAVGVEFASIFNSFGTQVTVIEILPRAVPAEDEAISTALEKSFARRGIRVMTSSEVKAVEGTARGARLAVETKGETTEIDAEKILLSVGRKPLTRDIGLETAGVSFDERGYVNVNEFMQTSAPSIYAIGDIVRTPWLAHVASAEGVLAVDHMAAKPVEPLDYRKTPACTYCRPEVASVGLSEKAARDAGYDVAVGSFPFSAIGKALIVGEPDGFVKIVSEKKYGEVLGVHIIGPKATELIAEACIGLRLEATVEEIFRTVHAHPTLSEAMLEAAHSVYGEAIHM
jgi:dihydrolipoamide dehydrogenase